MTTPRGHLRLVYAVALFLHQFLQIFASQEYGEVYSDGFIVEIYDDEALTFSIVSEQLQSEGIDHEVINDMSNLVPEVFKGATIKLQHSQQLEQLKRSRHIKRVTPVQRIHNLKPVTSQILDHPPAREAHSHIDSFGPHIQTRVADLHLRGWYGQGIQIALLDSGVDCYHPALGGGFGKGFTIARGMDFVGDNVDWKSSPSASNNPCTQCAIHGTHTTGIIAASSNAYGGGVSPNSSIGMYRVFGCRDEGGTRSDILVTALLRAFKDGANVISASIGGPGGWSMGDVLSDCVNRLTERGVIIVLAGGNEGSEGLFFAERPASATGSISVGSVQASTSIVTTLLTSTGKKLRYHTAGRLEGEAIPVYVTATNATESDVCQPLGDETPDLSKYVVLVERGTCTFQLKITHLVAKGVRRVLFYMRQSDMITLATYMQGVEVGTISNEDASYLIAQTRKTPRSFTLTFPKAPHTYVPASDAGKISVFSQYGPSYDFKNLQPNILAVGGNIVSTVPRASGNYASFSGTSMATPQLAGIAALVLSIRGKHVNPQFMKNILTTTSQLVMTGSQGDEISSVIHQGAGLVNAYCAALAHTFLSAATFVLNDLHHFQENHSVRITNGGSETYTFRITHRPAQTLPTFSPGSHRVNTVVEPITGQSPAEVLFDTLSFQLAPWESKMVTFTFKPPKGLDQALLPVYSGYISFISEAECESHNVPYYGIYGVMKQQAVIDRGPDTGKYADYSLPRITDRNFEALGYSTMSFRRGNFMMLRYRLAFGSPHIRTELVYGHATLDGSTWDLDNDFRQDPKLYKNLTDTHFSTFRGMMIIGKLVASNASYNSRTPRSETEVYLWDGSINPIENTTKIIEVPGGIYKILFRALRINGDPNHDKDWDAWLSQSFHVTQ
ncbi:hypothetical protein CROQUDRAFT_54319 [Cronartium quercuum f. sp. fusiforme G11]|uniref:Uncharacterized protein n=1 Tax=Cronartium quercuum f. sp. fusiforme G11 TaxID=708437 RepID=A0A9P6N9D3_9BASI|nr:hypothetical protein CROQUDRAFT_54319 [Cronartium quercuum f. sp. fusiforme G11]